MHRIEFRHLASDVIGDQSHCSFFLSSHTHVYGSGRTKIRVGELVARVIRFGAGSSNHFAIPKKGYPYVNSLYMHA